MDSDQIDKYNMLLKVDDFLGDHTADTAGHSKIAPKYAELQLVIVDIEEAKAEADADNTGATEDKAADRAELEQQVFTALTAVASFARDTKNHKLLRRVDFTLSELKGMRDASLYSNGEMVRKKTDENIVALADYAYLPTQLTALADALQAFHNSIPEPKDAREESAVANEQVAVLLKKADGILTDLDGYMDTFRFSNAALWSEYKMARAIDSAGGGTGSGSSGEYRASGTLTPGQTATVLEFEYDDALVFTITNNGPAPQMEATLLLDGSPISSAPPATVNVGTPASGPLGSWGHGNQLQLRNLDAGMTLAYSVTLAAE
ncbi:MAG: hypothetical protein GC178_07090 [Flavobacteriales bacterium]|nr:hypothetical protein [Flavobacteriales bacterium]